MSMHVSDVVITQTSEETQIIIQTCGGENRPVAIDDVIKYSRHVDSKIRLYIWALSEHERTRTACHLLNREEQEAVFVSFRLTGGKGDTKISVLVQLSLLHILLAENMAVSGGWSMQPSAPAGSGYPPPPPGTPGYAKGQPSDAMPYPDQPYPRGPSYPSFYPDQAPPPYPGNYSNIYATPVQPQPQAAGIKLIFEHWDFQNSEVSKKFH